METSILFFCGRGLFLLEGGLASGCHTATQCQAQCQTMEARSVPQHEKTRKRGVVGSMGKPLNPKPQTLNPKPETLNHICRRVAIR